VYPGICLLEGTNLSEPRPTRPFECSARPGRPAAAGGRTCKEPLEGVRSVRDVTPHLGQHKGHGARRSHPLLTHARASTFPSGWAWWRWCSARQTRRSALAHREVRVRRGEARDRSAHGTRSSAPWWSSRAFRRAVRAALGSRRRAAFARESGRFLLYGLRSRCSGGSFDPLTWGTCWPQRRAGHRAVDALWFRPRAQHPLDRAPVAPYEHRVALSSASRRILPAPGSPARASPGIRRGPTVESARGGSTQAPGHALGAGARQDLDAGKPQMEALDAREQLSRIRHRSKAGYGEGGVAIPEVRPRRCAPC